MISSTDIDKIFRDEAGRALATLIRLVGDFDLAEDALQDAFAVALERWSPQDVPDNPRAWLVNVGRNKAIDRIRRQIAFRGKEQALVHELELDAQTPDDPPTTLDDDMLRLIFTCCHPAFAAEVQVALTLRTVCGLTTAQVEVLGRWIADGAAWPREVVLRPAVRTDPAWWSLRPLSGAGPPALPSRRAVAQPVEAPP